MKRKTYSPPAISAIVLCGGGSTRMGTHKAALTLGDETLLARVVRIVGNIARDVVVVDHPDRDEFSLPPRARVAFDHEPDLGPLAGVLAGLRAAKHDVAYVTSCDVPFLRESFVRCVVDALGDAEVAMPEVEGIAQPLSAVYRARTVETIKRLLKDGERRPRRVRDSLKHRTIHEDMLRTVDPELVSLINVNRPQDFERARRRFGEAQRPRLVIELFELARQRAGVDRVDIEAPTLQRGLAQLASMHPALVDDVLKKDGTLTPHWRLLRGDRGFVEDIRSDVAHGEVVALMSALAGG